MQSLEKLHGTDWERMGKDVMDGIGCDGWGWMGWDGMGWDRMELDRGRIGVQPRS